MGSLPATTEAPRFGKYSLVARLATGGMAEIFLARLQGAAGFEKLVCIKRILPHLARDKQFVAMFLDEARIAARISHPNVCQVFELGEIDGSYYIAMEYLEGVPLACFRRRDYYGAMPEPRLVAGIAVQACEGLHHAHQLRNSDGSVMEVVHRDISPQNLFVTVDGIVKVLDFGIAKIHDASVRTTTGAVKGTYAYMAPEQLRGERVDRRTDVFAMGIVMWETLTRRHLFKRDTDFLTFQAITTEPIEDVRVQRPDVPAALSAVIMTALSRDRDERFPTARILGEAIAGAVLPFTGSAISEEIARAFPAELGEQAALLRVAREGGSFDLDLDRGPSVGHGTELLTTPTSSQYGLSELVVPPAGAVTRVERGAPPRRVHRRSWRPLAIAAFAVAVGGVGAYGYAKLAREPARPASGPGLAAASIASAAAPSAPEAIAAAPSSPAPTAHAPAAASVAPAPTAHAPAAASIAPAPTAPAPAAASVAPAPTAHDLVVASVAPSSEPTAPRPDKHVAHPPAAPSAPRAGGPPGYITIDSAPVYAVIYVDGKSYGETPLVKLALPAGRHTVHAVAPSGATRDVRITIEAGRVAPASRIEW